MKVIFLDFDGVITTPKSGYNLSPELMEKVKKICDETGAKIVVSSSWRFGSNSVEDFIRSITEDKEFCPVPFSFPKLIVGITPTLLDNGEKYYTHTFRGSEIGKYLMNHEEVTRYILLDDEAEYYPGQKIFLIQTSPEIGISDDVVEKAIELLNKSPEEHLKSLAVDSTCLDSFEALDLEDALRILKELREKYSWKDPKDWYPKDKFVLCKMKSNGAIVGGFIFEDNGKFKISTLPDFEFEDYQEYEIEAWTYEYEE